MITWISGGRKYIRSRYVATNFIVWRSVGTSATIVSTNHLLLLGVS